MNIPLKSLDVPIRMDEHGTARVGGTRVTLLSVLSEFRNGATPEQIVQEFDCLSLHDVYAVIAFYLRDRPAVDVYLERQERVADEVQKQMELHYPPRGIREQLLARRKEPA
jgi:uncharacterized protein (DUF433 family)